jgi:DNA-binding transcriptional ArsR family regulator
MAVNKPMIVDTASPRAGFKLEVVSGTRFELLIAMYAAEGARGELWLHLLGLALDSRAPDAAAFIDEVAGVPALELRRHVLGAYVPSWRHVAGAATIERAARGDACACERLLENRRYYAGAARPALAALLPLGARHTKSRLIAELQAFHDSGFAAREGELRRRLAADASSTAAMKREGDPYDVIDRAAGGYRYEAEAEFDRVVLLPQLAAAPSILLCQHRNARLICYPAVREAGAHASLVALGRALADEKRVAMLERLRQGEATLAELAREAGVAKSTAHHHLTQLRAARLITLRGNAAGYSYAVDESGFAAAERLLATFL